MLGRGDSPGAPAEPAPMADIPQLWARGVGSLWPGRSPRGELLCRWDGVANRGGDSHLGGETGEVAPNIWGILCRWAFLGTRRPGEGKDAHRGLVNPHVKSAGGRGVMGMGKVPEQTGVPYLLVVPGGPGVAGLQGRAAPARAGGTGWLSLRERGAMAGGHLCSCPPRASLGSRGWG